jgi:hypothetical protein
MEVLTRHHKHAQICAPTAPSSKKISRSSHQYDTNMARFNIFVRRNSRSHFLNYFFGPRLVCSVGHITSSHLHNFNFNMLTWFSSKPAMVTVWAMNVSLGARHTGHFHVLGRSSNLRSCCAVGGKQHDLNRGHCEHFALCEGDAPQRPAWLNGHGSRNAHAEHEKEEKRPNGKEASKRPYASP